MAGQETTIREICEAALQKIGSFSIYDSAADGEELQRAAFFLDRIVAHVAGTRRRLWLIPSTLTITLEAEKQSYNLKTFLGANYPTKGIQFPVNATSTEVATGREQDVAIVSRWKYDELTDKSDSGRPNCIYIDQLNDPTLYVYPVPDTDSEYAINLTFQSFNQRLQGFSDSPQQDNYTDVPDFREAWNLYLINALAMEIGDGPVRKLQEHELRRFSDRATDLLRELDGFEDQEHISPEEKRVAFNDF